MPIIRKFNPSGYQHIYQISIDGSAIFCTYPDCILLFTLISTYARRLDVRIVCCVIMINHFHLEAAFRSAADMELFMQLVTQAFARRYNKKYGRKGKLFHKPYGSSLKVQDSKIVSSFIYIANNPVVKQAVKKAEDYRWNFLRYRDSPNPFSEPYSPDEASNELKSLVKLAEKRQRSGKCLSYDLFDSKNYQNLSKEERGQLIDIIINTYNCIDYSPIVYKFGSMAKFYEAASTVGGSDYDINDDFEKEDYRHYYKMVQISKREGFDLWDKRFTGTDALSDELFFHLMRVFRDEAGASDNEICKLMGIPRSKPTKR